LALIVNHQTLSYKRLRWTPLPRGQKKKRLRQGWLEHNTTQFSRGRRVLRSGGPNHVNHCVPRVHLGLTTKRLKAFPAKEPQLVALERLRWKSRKTTSTQYALYYYVRKKKGEERERREKKKGRKKRKEKKKWENFPNLEISRKKNKR
jgi:hypothetical protein